MNSSALDTIRQRQLYLWTATNAHDSVRPHLAPAVAELDAFVDRILAQQIWDPTSPDHGNPVGHPVTPAEVTFGTQYFGYMDRMARMWRCPFSKHSRSAAVLERTLGALRFLERFVRPDAPRDGSWFYWDIWCPSVLSRMLIMLGDEIPADLRARLAEDLAHLPAKVFTLDRQLGITRPPIQAGYNNLEILHTGLLRGVALHDPQWLTTVTQQIPIAMGRAPGGEGLQNEWSYHFHGHGVNAGYGLGSLILQGHWLYLTHGTPWQVPTEVRELHVGMIREFFARNMWRGRVAPYSIDRGIAGPGQIHATSYIIGILYGLNTDLPA